MAFKSDFEAMCTAKLETLKAVPGLSVECKNANEDSANPSFFIDLTTEHLCGRATAYHIEDMFDVQVVDKVSEDLVLNEHTTDVAD